MNTTHRPLTRAREDAARAALRRGKNARPAMLRRSSVAHAVDGAGDAALRVSGPSLVVYLKDTARVRRESGRFFARWGIAAAFVWEAPDGEADGWQVVGPADALDALLSQWWAERPHRLMSVRVGGAAAGGGELSEGAKRRLREARELRLRDGEDRPSERELREAFPAVLAANGLDK